MTHAASAFLLVLPERKGMGWGEIATALPGGPATAAVFPSFPLVMHACMCCGHPTTGLRKNGLGHIFLENPAFDSPYPDTLTHARAHTYALHTRIRSPARYLVGVPWDIQECLHRAPRALRYKLQGIYRGLGVFRCFPYPLSLCPSDVARRVGTSPR